MFLREPSSLGTAVLGFAGLMVLAISVPWPAGAATGDSSPAQGEIVAGVPKHFPPHYVVDKDGRITGFAVEVMDELARRANLKVTYKLFDSWAELHQALRDGRVDLIPNVGISERRKQWGVFSQPYESFRVLLYVRNDDQGIRDLDDLRGRNAGTVETNIAEELLPEYTGLPPRIYPAPEALLAALEAGEIDIAAYPGPPTDTIAMSTGARDRIRQTGPPLAVVDRGILVRNGRADLMAVLAPHINAFSTSEAFDAIYERWFAMRPATTSSWWKLTAGLAILVMFATLIAVGWRVRRSLSGEVSRPEQAEVFARLWRRIAAVFIVMSFITLVAAALAITILYRIAFDQERMKLLDAVESEKNVLEAVARFDKKFSNYPDGPRAGTLAQIRGGLSSANPSWETVVGERAGDQIRLILRQEAARIEAAVSLPLDSDRVTAVRRAIEGQTGIMEGPDYSGKPVVAAYAPLPNLDLGLVIQETVADIRRPYVHAAWTVVPVAVAFSLLGTLAYYIMVMPIIRQVVESEERFSLAIRGTHDGLWDWDLRTDRVYYSPRWKSLLGYEDHEIGNHLDEWRRLVHPEDTEPTLAAVQAYIERRRPKLRREFRMRHKDGHWVHILSRGYGVWNEQGECVRLIGVHTDLSELRAAEDRAREYARFPHENPNPVLRIDRNGDVLLANAAAQALLTHLVEDESSDTAYRYLEAWRVLIARAKAARKPDQFEFQSAGHEFLFQIVPGPEGRTVNLYGTDITERIRAENTLRANEERFRALIENVQDSIIIVSPDGTIRYRSPSAEQLFGYESEETVGKDAFSFVHPDDRYEVATELAALVAKPRGTAKAEFRVRRKDGEWRNCNVIGKNVLAVPGIEGLLLTVRDVTEEKRAEETLRKLSRAIEQSTNLVVITNREGVIEYVNQAVVKTTGFSTEEVIGRTAAVWKSPRTPPEVHEKLWRTISWGNDWHGEFENRRKDGSYYHVKATVSPIRADDGAITHFIAVEEDVTEAHELEKRLWQAQKMEAVGQLTGGIAHDFNNLLMVIMGNMDLLEGALERDSPLLKWARAARRAGERGAELTSRLLAFSRQQILEPRTVQLNEAIREIEEILSRALSENIDLHLSLKPDLPPVRLDPGQLEHTLINLAVNARDAMPQGGQLTIETDTVALDAAYAQRHVEVTPGNYVMMAVTDTGSGMTSEQIEHAFEPFYTTKEPGRGTGLGLSMVYGFVKQSGGQINVYSEPGEGTTFKLFFPISEVSAEIAAETNAAEAGQTAGGERILVVEDDPEVRNVLESMLGQLGYRSLIATDAADALRQLENSPDIDLLLTDVVMPGEMDGPQLAAEVTARHPGIRVLFSSGYAEEALRRRGGDFTTANWISKPYTIHHLAQRLRDVLGTPV